MKRELYTMNENSSHKNDDFCIKIVRYHPYIIIIIDNIYLFIIELMIITWTILHYIWKLIYEWSDPQKRQPLTTNTI